MLSIHFFFFLGREDKKKKKEEKDRERRNATFESESSSSLKIYTPRMSFGFFLRVREERLDVSCSSAWVMAPSIWTATS